MSFRTAARSDLYSPRALISLGAVKFAPICLNELCLRACVCAAHVSKCDHHNVNAFSACGERERVLSLCVFELLMKCTELHANVQVMTFIYSDESQCATQTDVV